MDAHVVMTPETLPLPEFCLTAQEPWPQAIAYADKRLENRGYGVVNRLGEWRGLIGISQSKVNLPSDKVYADVVAVIRDLRDAGLVQWQDKRLRDLNIGAWRGKLCLVAELISVVAPQYMRHVLPSGHPYSEVKRWHVDGEFGLILGSVWEVEPIPCTGGQGAWQPRWCLSCGHIQADSQGSRCRGCKASLGLVLAGKRPLLKVVRECES